jgi:hypothetical protein
MVLEEVQCVILLERFCFYSFCQLLYILFILINCLFIIYYIYLLYLLFIFLLLGTLNDDLHLALLVLFSSYRSKGYKYPSTNHPSNLTVIINLPTIIIICNHHPSNATNCYQSNNHQSNCARV